MSITRRAFVRAGAAATVLGAMPGSSLGAYAMRRTTSSGNGLAYRSELADPDHLKMLALRAIDAAKGAGATYADVRITRSQKKQLAFSNERNLDECIAGVRVLTDGAWGFAAHSEVDPETMAWLGTMSAELAKANVWPKVPPIAMETAPVVTGTWHTEIQTDPFRETDEPQADPFRHIADAVQAHGGKLRFFQTNFERQDRFFASSEGSVTNQRVYTAFNDQLGSQFFSPQSAIIVEHPNGGIASIPGVSPTGAGWEVLAAIEKRIPEALEQAARMGEATNLDQPGRYDVVFDGAAMAALVSVLGQASELDRAIGLESSSDQTSFMAPVDEKLGQLLFPSSLNVIADRTMQFGAATVGWDDEGVAPNTFTVIKEGVLLNYGTGRERIPEVVEWYKSHGRSATSHGCMTAEGGKFMPLITAPNLTLVPSTQDIGFDDLLSGMKDGFAVFGGSVDMDNRLMTGWGTNPTVYTVRNGKLAQPVAKATYTFSMLNHWKNLLALGGQRTAVTQGFTLSKGQPRQRTSHSVNACAAKFKDVVIRSVGLARV